MINTYIPYLKNNEKVSLLNCLKSSFVSTAGPKTGEFEKCISYKDIKRTKVLGDDKILFEMKRNKFLLNTMSTSCTRLGVDRQFVFQHGNAKICARDIVSTARGGCNLSEFEILDEKS